MKISDISTYHTLKPITLRPDQLLLDPNNPRITVDIGDLKNYTLQELTSDDLQDDILKRINKSQNHVADIIESIGTTGFVKGTTPLMVKKITEDKYLVLEGNRRVTAIKYLLKNKKNISNKALNTLDKIDVNEFIYTKNEFFSEESIIDFLLGLIHISGPLGWGAMEKAHHIYNTYVRSLKESLELKEFSDKDFKIDDVCLKEVCDIYGFKKDEIKNNIMVYKIYKQLRGEGYEVDTKKYTLIELSLKDNNIRNSYFEFQNTCKFSRVGLDRFDKIILSNKSSVTNPQDFKIFSFIVKNGKENDLKSIENGLSSLTDIYRKLKENDNSKTTEKKLGDILDRLEVLNVSDFSSSEEETKIIKKIQDVVINKFVRLINEDNAVNLTKKAYPKTIKEAFALESTDLQNIILETLRNRPNMTCIADRLPGFVISYLGIITRGEPRIKFETIVKREINQLLEISVLHKYSTDSNTRYRLLG